MKSVMKNSTPDCLKPGVLFCSANGLFKQGLQITAKGRGHLFDVGAGGIHEKVVVFPRTPFLPTEESVILCTVAVDLCNPFLHLRFCQVLALRMALHAAFDSALHICISKNTHRLLLPENMVRAAPDDDAVGFAGQLTKQLMLLCVDGEFRIERGL